MNDLKNELIFYKEMMEDLQKHIDLLNKKIIVKKLLAKIKGD